MDGFGKYILSEDYDPEKSEDLKADIIADTAARSAEEFTNETVVRAIILKSVASYAADPETDSELWVEYVVSLTKSDKGRTPSVESFLTQLDRYELRELKFEGAGTEVFDKDDLEEWFEITQGEIDEVCRLATIIDVNLDGLTGSPHNSGNITRRLQI